MLADRPGHAIRLAGKLDFLIGPPALRPDEDQHTLHSMTDMGALLNGQERYGESEPLLREFMEKGASVHEPGCWHIARARSLLGESLAGQGRFDEAESLLVEGQAGLESALPAELRTRELRLGVERLVLLYEEWNL